MVFGSVLLAAFVLSVGALTSFAHPIDRRQVPIATPTFPAGIIPNPDVIPTPTFPVGIEINPPPNVVAPPAPPALQPLPTANIPNPASPPPVDLPLPAEPPIGAPPPALPITNPPKFLTLPFPPDPKIQLLQGWYYDSLGLHQGVDFFRLDDGWVFTGFPILAAADGYACGDRDYPSAPSPPAPAQPDATATPELEHRPVPHPDDWWDDPKMIPPWQDDPRQPSDTVPTPTPPPSRGSVSPDGVWGYCVSGFGDRVLIRHEVDGQSYYTYYGHLETIASEIPIGSRSNTVRVERGQVIGYAGNTGTGSGAIHLHFGLATPGFGWLDPYDIWTTHGAYPDPAGTNGQRSGPNHFWTTNPPSHRPTPKQSPEGYVVRPTHNAVVVGRADIRGWARAPDSAIRTVEIWIDGEFRDIATYGLPERSPTGNIGFSWEWDTTNERNGEHIIEVQAISAEDEHVMLLSSGAAHEESFPVIVQNPEGALDRPVPGTTASGTVEVRGWAHVTGSSLRAVEVWIDGIFRGTATYGLPHESAGGDYGFSWEWDTTNDDDGEHRIQIRALAINGGSRLLVDTGADGALPPIMINNHGAPPADEVVAADDSLPIKHVGEHVFVISKWTIR